MVKKDVEVATMYIENGKTVKGAIYHATIIPPEGMSQKEFDDNVLRTALEYPLNERPYDATKGYNSNTFVNDVIESAGGIMPNIPGATQQNFGETYGQKETK